MAAAQVLVKPEFPENLEDAIRTLKRERNAVLLAHYYQEGEIQDLADFVGDSLALARIQNRSSSSGSPGSLLGWSVSGSLIRRKPLRRNPRVSSLITTSGVQRPSPVFPSQRTSPSRGTTSSP